MKFSKETESRIIAALLPRLTDRRLGLCGICGQRTWRVLNTFIAMPASTELEGQPPTSPDVSPTKASQDRILPFVGLVCTNCGNTHFLNLRILGLDELLLPAPEVSESLKLEE
jgi:hypothetical protein